MIPDFNINVLGKVKQTLNRITLSSHPKKVIPHNHLVVMNIPALMGRRDAAYEQAIKLLNNPLSGYSKENRNAIYNSVLDLLSIAIEATKEIIIPTETKENQTETIQHYMFVLRDTVQAAEALVKHALILAKDEQELTLFIGSKEVTEQFKSTDETFTKSEINIYHCIKELVNLAKTAMIRHRENKKKSFSKTNLLRYNKSLDEYTSLYKNYGVISE